MELDWLAVVMATVVGMAVAGAWYGKVFTTLWSTLTGVVAEDSKKASRRNMALLLVANAVTAVGLTVTIEVAWMAAGSDALWLALLVGFAAWLTFSATTLLQHNAFELKPVRLTLLNSAYQLVLFLGMALTIGLV
ncbi:DUF1761 domain-containing protein [Mycobacteroides abscessus]|uniref:DUF1761 domain-containing protein n=1 Tax=Mycobacteroides abscessus TaxID=36809 RepID=A0ABD7HIJ8_9MYCO|nr:DUF1761 domain-containing protein [Mycobacteroides abscessus]PVA77467.1 DUF1761 domain-containing protein [Mycobacteroides abscessus]PVB23669.1 DUF1761 domain-containing protein [Mycobacteroides abscessus]RIR48326.1 DUF1761 domain-containing protein [Mycobacteroides abscessus]RIR63397.1 DUF1761 domain-containing protein [Mycobacteroides abscessus]RIR73812.1 DUF1761 domain-containing protein [Mycobacteroides abscessus]